MQRRCFVTIDTTSQQTRIRKLLLLFLDDCLDHTQKISKLHGECASYWLVVVIIGHKTLMGKLI